jgi:hypothetical protein
MKPLWCVPLLAGHAFTGAAWAADATEFWPEISAFIAMTPDTRLYLNATYEGGDASDTLDLSVAIDISIKPILREQYWSEDWQRSRYFWTRVGYTRVLEASSTPENRGVVSLYGRAPLPEEVWLEARARADLRWIGDSYSARYRFRLEASREFTVHERAVVPYFSVEWFYDTRYQSWSRTLYKAGAEVTVTRTFRCEIYLARQADSQPSSETIDALGLVAKWYF